MLHRLIGLALALLLGPGCVHPPPQLSPEGKVAFHARRVLTGVEALQQVAIEAEAEGIIPEKDARAIVKATVEAAKAARTLAIALNAGYEQADLQRKMITTIRAILQELPSHLSPKAYDLVQPYVQAVVAALRVYGY